MTGPARHSTPTLPCVLHPERVVEYPHAEQPGFSMDRDCWAPHGLMLGDVGSLYLFTCTACAERPLAGTMQCT